jgi:hypothetical protein
MRSRRRTSELKQNAKFLGGIVAVSAIVGMGIAVSTQGLDTMMHRISLGLKAMDNPTQLSADEKSEVRKLVKDKASAMKQYESLAPDQKEQAKQQFNSLSEAEKKKYREMLGR